ICHIKEVSSLQSFAWLIGFLLVGEIIETVLHVPIPGNVIGMLLLFLSLQMKWIKLDQVKRAADILLAHMMLFFAPMIVGTIAYTELLKDNLLAIIAVITVGTLAVLISSGLSAKLLEKKSRRESRTHG